MPRTLSARLDLQLVCCLGLLFLFGCQSANSDKAETMIYHLRTELEVKKDSIATLQALLLANEERANGREQETVIQISEIDVNLQSKPSYKLYQRPVIQEINNAEFAEVISSTDTVATFIADEFRITAVSVCNGPADPNLEYCNCSNFIYVVTATDGEYSDYRLFKIGPFYLPQFKGWKKDKVSPELTIEHEVKGKKKIHIYRITETGVKQI
jgi:hypothetical protein